MAAKHTEQVFAYPQDTPGNGTHCMNTITEMRDELGKFGIASTIEQDREYPWLRLMVHKRDAKVAEAFVKGWQAHQAQARGW